MATYEELFDLRQDSNLLNKITSAIAVKCKAVIDAVGATAGQKTWAREVIQNPDGKKGDVIWPLLVANKDATVAQIQSAADTLVQTNVNTAIDDLIADLT